MKKIFLVFFGFNCTTAVLGQVSLQTGSAVFGLPVFTWQDDKSRLAVSVSLNYNSQNGLKVNDIATNVGQGWALSAGGVITRLQVGEPDDQPDNEGDGTTGDVNKYPPGYLYNSVDASQGCPSGLGYYPIFGDQNHVYKQHNDITADREQDYFLAQFNGRSIQFVLGKNNGDKGIMVGNSRIKISFLRDQASMVSQHIRTTIVSFTIQDEDGLIYTFSQIGTAKTLRMHPSLPNPASGVLPQPTYSDGGIYCQTFFDEIPLSYNPYVITSWYLTSIQDPLTQRIVNFNYTLRTLNNYAGDNIVTSVSGGDNSDGIMPSKTYVVITRNLSMAKTPFLTSIQCPDGHLVSLNYDMNNPRPDLPGDYPMKSVDITYQGRAVSRFQLNMTYFILNAFGQPSTPDQKAEARLCLKSITKIGLDLKENQPLYSFDYYTGSNTTEDFVPPPFYYVKDIWGYYNGSMASSIINGGSAIPIMTTQLTDITSQEFFFLNFTQLKALCFLGSSPTGMVYNYNTSKPGYAKNGLLKAITYPSGGTTTYDYQQNIYNNITSPNTVTQAGISSGNYTGGVHVSQITQTDGGYSNGSSNPIVTAYNYVDPTGTLTSQWGVEDPVNHIIANYNFSLDGSHQPFLGGCKYDFQFPGISYKEQALSLIDNQQSLQMALKIFKAVLLARSITTDILAWATEGNFYLLLFDVLQNIVTILTTDCDDNPQSGFTVNYENSDIRSDNPFPAQFSRLEVVPGGTASIGKTVYEFTDLRDYALWDGTTPLGNILANPTSMKQRAAPWAYGLLKKMTIYNATGHAVKQTENDYDFNNAQQVASSDHSCNCSADPVMSMRSDTWSGFSNTANMTYSTSNSEVSGQFEIASEVSASYYQVFTGRVDLIDTYERFYQQDDPTRFLESHSHFDINPNNFQPKKITTFQSNGDQRIKEIYYTSDYTAPGILQSLNANNIVNDAVGTFSSIIKSNSSAQVYMGASVTQYSTVSNGNIKPTALFIGRSTQPVTGFSFDPNAPMNYPNLVGTQFLGYDGSGNLVRVQDEGGRVMSNIYDYNDKFIVATVLNADPDIDQSAYTSFETSNGGGWAINGTPSYSSLSITGVTGFNLNEGGLNPNSISTNITFNKPYILSYWATQSSSITLTSGLVLAKTGPTLNGFTYFEYTVPQGSGGLIIHGNGTIDELRLYPSGARMKSNTYDPLIGKTSECDINNRITYYEYDNLARLRFIKNENKNIVRMYEYNARQSGSLGSATAVSYAGTVFAQLSLENVNFDAAGEAFADVVVRFFADAACTQPVFVNNVTVNLSESGLCDNSGPVFSATPFFTVGGTNAVLFSQAFITQVEEVQDEAGNITISTCNTTFTLTAGQGYTVVN